MSTDLRDEDLVRRARSALDRSVDELDPATLGRLRAARRNALDGVAPAGRRRAFVWVPLGALAAAAVALVIAFSARPTEVAKAPPPPPRLVEDLEVVVSNDDLELYADLEFYEWLEQQDQAG